MNTEETAQDTAITSNDVGNGHSPAEDLLKKTWKQLQASTKAVKMSSYLCTVFEAQAKVYEKAAKEPGEEMRSAYMKRGIALGVLADSLKQSPALSMHVSSKQQMLEALVQVESVQKILDKAASYAAAAQEEQAE